VLLVSNGSAWVIIWGWRFNSLNVNYRVPEFTRIETTPVIESQEEDKILSIEEMADHSLPLMEDPLPETPLNNAPEETRNRIKLPWWRRIFHFLRWFTYRFWLLLLMLALIPLVFCFLRWLDRWLCMNL
jgi:hypothetical protein